MNMKDKIKLELKNQYEIERDEDNYKLIEILNFLK